MNEIEIYSKIEKWLMNNKEVAIANVIKTWGSSPRPVGSIMAVNSDNKIIGSVSGGCIESFVFGKAIEVIKQNKVMLLDFGVSNSKAWEVGLTCGGKISIFLEKISKSKLEYIKKIKNALLSETPMVIATRLKDGKKEIVEGNYVKRKNNLKNKMLTILKSKTSKSELFLNEEWFFKIFKNDIKLIIVGAVHIAEPLIKYAKILGYKIYLIDPRNNFKNKINQEDVLIIIDWPDEALKKITIDSSTAIVTLTHDPKLDDPALVYSLKSNAFYIGCLGSIKTHNSRLKRLEKKGFNNESLKKLNGPVGINIGAKTPAEIASSIISQIIEKKNIDA